MTIKQIEASFENEPNTAMQTIYALYRESFYKFSKSYCQDEEAIVDCFQESIITLYESLVKGKIRNKESSLKTYLFAIGKNKLLKRYNKKQIKTTELTEHAKSHYPIHEIEATNIYQLQLENAFQKLGKKCKDVILRFYYNKHSLDMIAAELDYKNVNTVKAHKSRCLSKLKSIVDQNSKL